MSSNKSLSNPVAEDGRVDASNSAGFLVINILTYIFLSSVMFGVGAGIKIADLHSVVKDRKGAILIGLGCQYFFVPAIGRLVSTVILSMPAVDAYILILICCCPGGAVSNVLTYFAKGDLALSVAMTAISNAAAFATLPLLLFIWTTGLTGIASKFPFLEIFYSLLLVLIPAGLGILLRHKYEKYGRWAEKCGAIGGGVMIAGSIFAGLFTNLDTLQDSSLFPWKNAVAVTLVAPCGMISAFGATYVSSRICCRRKTNNGPAGFSWPVTATIVIETGVQNTVLALAIHNMTFQGIVPDQDFFRMQLMIICWGLIVSFLATCAMIFFRFKARRISNEAAEIPANAGETEKVDGEAPGRTEGRDAQKMDKLT